MTSQAIEPRPDESQDPADSWELARCPRCAISEEISDRDLISQVTGEPVTDE